MDVVYFLILFVFAAKCHSISIVEAENGRKLKAVAVLYRHGDRAPIASYPQDPYFDKKYWPEGFGELLKTGKERQYELGLFLRKRYNNFLSKEYSKDEIFVRSSDVDRTLTSAASNLAGLYYKDNDDIFKNNLHWDPIPIHTLPLNEDAIIYMSKSCPKYNELYNEVSEALYNELYEENPETFEIISNATSWPNEQIDFVMLYGTFYCYQMTNKSYLPIWYSSLNQTIFKNFAGRQFIKENTTELKRLGTGPFLTYLTNHFDNVINGSAPKFLMLSGHDMTIAAVLNAMEVYDYNPPEFASMVIWDLYEETDGNYTMEVFYKVNSDSDPERLKVMDKEQAVSYEAFKTFLEPLFINEARLTDECYLRPSSSTTISLSIINIFVMVFVFFNF